MLQVKYRGRSDTAWNPLGKKNCSFLGSEVLPRPLNARSLLFWCAVSLHFWKWTTAISVLFPVYLGGTSCSHCFWNKMFFGFHRVTCLQREVNLLWHDKRALKSSPSSCESESEEKGESETLKNISRFIKCHREPYGALITCVSCCKA